jgi:hypothetical protein
MSSDKRTEVILKIGGGNRIVKDVMSLDTLINLLVKSKQECEEKGYTNLTLYLRQDSCWVDMWIHGDRDLTEDEKDAIERMEVITREKDKTSKGLRREDLLK